MIAKLSDETLLVSVLGINFKLGKFDNLGICDEETTDEIIRIIKAHNLSNIIFDYTSLTLSGEHKVFTGLLLEDEISDRKVAHINLSIRLFDRMKIELTESRRHYTPIEELRYYFTQNLFKGFTCNNFSFITYISKAINEIDISVLSKSKVVRTRQLKSTPYWTNCYFNLGKTFNNTPLDVCWLVSRMCYKIQSRYPENSKICLTTSSPYGNIFATLLKLVLDSTFIIKIKCFDRLGPDMFLSEVGNDKHEVYDYNIYICDFIIGGTELKLLKGLLSRSHMNLNAILAIATYLEPTNYEEENIKCESLFMTKDLFPEIKYSLTRSEL